MGKLIDYSILVFIDDTIIGRHKGERKEKISIPKSKKVKADSCINEDKPAFIPSELKTMFNSFDNVIKDLHPDIFKIVKLENIRKLTNTGNKVIVWLDYFKVEIESKNDNKKEYVISVHKNVVNANGEVILKKGDEFLRINDDSKTKRMQEILNKTPKELKLYVDLGMQFFENKERAIFIRKNIRLRINKFPDKSVFELILSGTEPFRTITTDYSI